MGIPGTRAKRAAGPPLPSSAARMLSTPRSTPQQNSDTCLTLGTTMRTKKVTMLMQTILVKAMLMKKRKETRAWLVAGAAVRVRKKAN